MRKVTGKKKDMENGENIDAIESENEENGVDEDSKFSLHFFSPSIFCVFGVFNEASILNTHLLIPYHKFLVGKCSKSV